MLVERTRRVLVVLPLKRVAKEVAKMRKEVTTQTLKMTGEKMQREMARKHCSTTPWLSMRGLWGVMV